MPLTLQSLLVFLGLNILQNISFFLINMHKVLRFDATSASTFTKATKMLFGPLSNFQLINEILPRFLEQMRRYKLGILKNMCFTPICGGNIFQ